MTIIIPIIIAALIVYAAIKKVNPYDAFAEGAAEAVPTILHVLPYLGAMLMAINLFRRSGAMDALTTTIAPAMNFIGIPPALAPLAILRPFSGSAALAMLQDLLITHGADSFIGCAASVMVGSTETIFYTVSLYCGCVNVSKTRHAIPVAIFSGIVGAVSGVLLVKLMLF